MARQGPSKREAIVEAAKALLWERGYEATSPRDVLARSGAGQGSLYHHFPGKREVAAAALAEMAAEEIGAVDALFGAPAPPLARVRAYLTREREALRGCRLARLANEAAMEEPALRAPVAAYVGRIQAALRGCLEEARAAGTLAATVEPGSLAALLIAAVEGGYVLARVHWDPGAMRAALDGAVQVLDAVSRPEGAAPPSRPPAPARGSASGSGPA
ncbi:putative HTH-type transcriptional regulator YxaF [Methylobacterium crusticola]|uniref:HTH-type transcriptional regulator YxaF n=1 Tax=Methylobacterium crusticola TaxID=1697972 RepID=A0ABQ4QS86_9HYPH|nr:TetR/AcrR family transcriptional regulator [Methylobacterium crusticola]GJD47467.1 putative HTH-type transcriptional regulator YxaF [Methylobacterium crusticola]